jgi:predicted aldo/keto reductase-like oxidoreductase
MKYRKFGQMDWEVSALGIGTLRLPTEDKTLMSGAIIKEDEAIATIRYGIDNGVNYVDTAYNYHNCKAEAVVGKALKDGYRQKVKLATKSPVSRITKTEDFDRILDEQLTKLQTDHIDFYLLHSIDGKKWRNTVLALGLLERMEAAKKAGKIGHIGFSFHDSFSEFKNILDSYDKWEFCQIQYNYMDVNTQAGVKGLKYAASKGLPVIIMEPLLGGMLANPPASIKKEFEAYDPSKSAAYWGLRWLWNQPEVTLVLSGMGSVAQVEENIRTADDSGIGEMSRADLEFIEHIRKKYTEKRVIPCTGCSYCMPCPNGVEIPRSFKFFNDSFMHDDLDNAKKTYAFWKRGQASACVGCRVCESKCPQQIPISEWMPKVHAHLGSD